MSIEKPNSIGVNKHDVLFGRGTGVNSHVGNRTFRVLIRKHQKQYFEATRKKKVLISQKIVGEILASGGRFLCRTDDGRWVDADDSKALEKVKQTLRQGYVSSAIMESLKKKQRLAEAAAIASNASPDNVSSAATTERHSMPCS